MNTYHVSKTRPENPPPQKCVFYCDLFVGVRCRFIFLSCTPTPNPTQTPGPGPPPTPTQTSTPNPTPPDLTRACSISLPHPSEAFPKKNRKAVRKTGRARRAGGDYSRWRWGRRGRRRLRRPTNMAAAPRAAAGGIAEAAGATGAVAEGAAGGETEETGSGK